MFLVVVGESGCWLAGCGVIYSANELPLVLLNSGETSFSWYWSAYFSVGSGSLVNIKLINIWQTFFTLHYKLYCTSVRIFCPRVSHIINCHVCTGKQHLDTDDTGGWISQKKKEKKKKLGFLWSFCQILTYEPTGSKKVAVKTTQEKWCYSLAIEIKPPKPG